MTSLVSSNPVVFRSIIPKKLSVKGMVDEIRDAAIKAAKDMGKDLDAVVRTWKDEKPIIMTEAKLEPYNVFPKAFTASAWPKNDGSQGYNKFLWLDQGTKVRHAVMTNPFVAKTRPGKLQSWSGKGHMLFVSKKINLPGIKKREFIKTLRKRWEKSTMFKERMNAAIKRARKASGHAI